MDILNLISFLLLGLCVGSFLNVVILRLGTGRSIVTGRSECVHSRRPLPWYDLIPVFSFLMLKGKSRFSGKPLSIQYPVVEIITGLLFAGAYWKVFIQGDQSILLFILYISSLCLLTVISFYDLRTKIIPNPLVYSFIIISFFVLILEYGFSLWDFLAASILWFPFAFLWFVSGGTWMGYGDAKLAWGLGWFLGLLGGASAVLFSFWIGAVISLILILINKMSPFLSQNLSIKSEVPFAPFLVLGTLLVFFFGLDLLVFI